jgi:hypothetical protein
MGLVNLLTSNISGSHVMLCNCLWGWPLLLISVRLWLSKLIAAMKCA